MGTLYVLRKTKAMAQADRQQKTGPRLEIANVRVTATERAYLQQVASARAVSVSDLMRTALRDAGAMPPD